MSTDSGTPSTAASDFSLDSERHTLATTWRNYISKLRSGDLGPIPAMLGIGVLTLVFGLARSDTFLSVRNFGNLLQQAAPIIVISMAVSFVLLLGEIDLGAGFTAGVVAAVLATRLQANWSLPATIAFTAVVGAAMGLWTGFFVAKVGVPSFVVTLANFLSFQGIVLLITTEGGSVGIENKSVIAIENSNMSVGLSWAFAVVAVAFFAWSVLRKSLRSPETNPVNVAALKIAAVAVGSFAFVGLLSRNRAFSTSPKKIIGVPLRGAAGPDHSARHHVRAHPNGVGPTPLRRGRKSGSRAARRYQCHPHPDVRLHRVRTVGRRRRLLPGVAARFGQPADRWR